MGHDCEIQLPKVDTLGLHIVREDVGIIPGVEQDALAGNLYERRVTPVLSHRSVLAERIVEDRDTVLRLGSGRRSDYGGRHHHAGWIGNRHEHNRDSKGRRA